MSLYDYRLSRHVTATMDPTFNALIMAAMRQADTTNAGILRLAWPDVWNELWDRYNAPDGVLPGETEGAAS